MKIFKGYDIYVFADNVNEETYQFLQKNIDSSKIIRTKLSNAGSFMYSLNFAINNFNDDEKIYFAEDDYVYTQEAPKIIEEKIINPWPSNFKHDTPFLVGCQSS